MAARLVLLGSKVEITDSLQAVTEDLLLKPLLDSASEWFQRQPGYDPNPPLSLANFLVKRFGAVLEDYDPADRQEGRIY